MTVQRSLVRAVLVACTLLSVTTGVLAGDPGIQMPRDSTTPQVNDQARGFLLIYNIYTSSPANPATQNTRFSITNTNDQAAISVHLFFVDGVSCSIADRFVCLTPNQTTVFLASDQDPGMTGYLVAVASSAEGVPVPFDYLIGDEFVKFESGYFGSLGAEAIPSQNVIVSGFTADLDQFGMAIVGLPRVLAVDSIGSRADGNETLLVVNGVGGVFNIGVLNVGSLFGILYNDQEEAHSWNRSGGCQLIVSLSNDFPRTTPRFDVVIPAGQTGWMKFWSTSTINNGTPFGVDSRALLGAVFQRNASAATSAGAFQGARNLHKLNLLSVSPEFNGQVMGASTGPISSVVAQGDFPDVTVFFIPVFPTNCGFIEPERPRG